MSMLFAVDVSLPLKNPVIIFSLVLFIILFAPILFNKIKVPHIIGLIIAGVIVGPYGLNFLRRDSSIVLFGTVGLLYIMFLAGLEIDMMQFRKNKAKILTFGLVTFLLPLVAGTLASFFILGYPFLSSLLLASMFSTHTLVAYPIASKYGVIRNRAVALTVGGTMVTDILALLILAAVAGVTRDEASSSFWIQLGVSSLVFVALVFFLFPVIIRWFFKHFEDSVSQYIFVLATVFLASFLAEAAGLEPIIGAFFSGLVLNRFVPHSSPLMNRIGFVGNALFIPFFLISVGMLVDVTVLVKGWGALRVAVVIIVVAIVTKYIAAIIVQKLFRLHPAEGKLIFGLSSSHAAATLAIILVGYNIIIGETAAGEPIRLLNEDVLNGTILLILVSCGLGSFVVENAARELAQSAETEEETDENSPEEERVLVSLSGQEMMHELIDLGLMLRGRKNLRPIYALHIIEGANEKNGKAKAKKLLERAAFHAAATENSVIPLTRFDSSATNGIVYTAKEHNITELLFGLNKDLDNGPALGAKIDRIVRRIYDTIYVYKPTQPFNTLKRMFIVIPPRAELEPGFYHWLHKLIYIAQESAMPMHIYGAHPTLEQIKDVMDRQKQINIKYFLNHFVNWDDFLIFSRELKSNDLFVIVASRKGQGSYIPQLSKLPHYLSSYFAINSFIVLYPRQIEYGINMEDIQQTDNNFIETISERLGLLGKAGKYLRGALSGKKQTVKKDK